MEIFDARYVMFTIGNAYTSGFVYVD